jgi:hypothetical protein
MKWSDRYASKRSKDIEDRRGKPTPRPLPRPTSPPGDYATDWDAANWMKDMLRRTNGRPAPRPVPAPTPAKNGAKK